MTTAERHQRFLREHHRPHHARRTAATHAAFLLPSLEAGQRVLDLGCGPGSITVGLAEAVGPGGAAIGVDLDPGPAAIPLARADIHVLPFPDGSFDAILLCAVLQHVADPLATLVEARRVCRPGGVVGVADADWGSALVWPDDPLLRRGQEVLEALRPGTSPHVGRRLRGLLHDAGFVDARVAARGAGGGGPGSPWEGQLQAAPFDAPEVVDHAVGQGVATREEMAAVAAAWRRWGADPAATMARHWFEAVATAPAP
jgi:SAM-dependent methyltransferase